MCVYFTACFREDPDNLTVAINTEATFSCVSSIANPRAVAWSVLLPDEQKFFVDDNTRQKDTLMSRGFKFHTDNNTSYMSILATSSNNGSEFRCREFKIPNTFFSELGSLTVIGK